LVVSKFSKPAIFVVQLLVGATLPVDDSANEDQVAYVNMMNSAARLVYDSADEASRATVDRLGRWRIELAYARLKALFLRRNMSRMLPRRLLLLRRVLRGDADVPLPELSSASRSPDEPALSDVINRLWARHNLSPPPPGVRFHESPSFCNRNDKLVQNRNEHAKNNNNNHNKNASTSDDIAMTSNHQMQVDQHMSPAKHLGDANNNNNNNNNNNTNDNDNHNGNNNSNNNNNSNHGIPSTQSSNGLIHSPHAMK